MVKRSFHISLLNKLLLNELYLKTILRYFAVLKTNQSKITDGETYYEQEGRLFTMVFGCSKRSEAGRSLPGPRLHGDTSKRFRPVGKYEGCTGPNV